jgi:hypothetical protein
MNWDDLPAEFAKTFAVDAAIASLKHLIDLVGGRSEANHDIYSVSRMVTVFLEHRQKSILVEKLYEKAFESGKDVLYVSIMSKNTLDVMPKQLERAKSAGTKIRALTWDPAVGRKVAEAFRKHLGEFEAKPSNAYDQLCNASTTWKRLAAEFPSVITEVRQYDSVPTMQGYIVEGEWAVIELMPYHKKIQERPALYVPASIDAEIFAVFDSAFNNLWNDCDPSRPAG